MKDRLESFLLAVPDYQTLAPSVLIDYFSYFLTIIEEADSFLPSDIDACFSLTRLGKYSNVSTYLSRNSKKTKGKKAKYHRIQSGYQLERTAQLEIQQSLREGPAKQETSHLLRTLVSKLSDQNEKLFLQEAIDCYEIGAKRATVVLVWQLALHHLCRFVLEKELSAFNLVLSKNTDKRVKITSVAKMDDFSDIPEAKLIEFLRSAKIISNDVRKILDTKLGIRNTYAHPSSVTISEVKATDFAIDLVDNVILKYVL